MNFKKLGVFDSGIGGLSVLRELYGLSIPSFIYFADTKNLPYGEKSPDQIKEFTHNAVQLLHEEHEVDGIILACHTASAIALEHVKENFPFLPILGVVDPVVTASVAATQNSRIGIIGTPATVTSNVHKTKILQLNPQAHVFAQACPKLVPLIESGKQQSLELQVAIKEYLAPLRDAGIDTLIIGCTHYELIKDEISAIAGPTVQLISAPEQVIFSLSGSLTTSSPPNEANTLTKCHFIVTGNRDQFMLNAQKLVGGAVYKPKIHSSIVDTIIQ